MDELYGNVNKLIDLCFLMYNVVNYNYFDVLLGVIWYDLCGVLNKFRVRGCFSFGVIVYCKN